MKKKKSYTPVEADNKLIDIVEFLFQQTRPVQAKEISEGTGYAHGTVMSHLIVLLERKWVRMEGERYEIGPRVPGMYSAYKMGLEHKIAKLRDELNLLEA